MSQRVLGVVCKGRDLSGAVQSALLKLSERPKLATEAELLEVHWGLWWVTRGVKL
jgi:hypothetical protein